MVRRLNIDGDGQGDLGGHGGEQRAVLVYQNDSYRYWAEELGRDDLAPGQFGENFTVEGLPDNEVCIGDRYRIGGATFEVTQPRVTCYRVGLRMGEPRMAALLVAHHRPGFYLRVIEEGEVEAGQEIVKVSTGPEAMTVEEIDRVLYLPGHTRKQVERALRIPALSPGWQSSMQTLLAQADGDAAGGSSGIAGLTAAAGAPPPAWPGFRPLTVTHVQPESHSVFSVSLAAVDGSVLPAGLPGQFLTVKVAAERNAPPLIRSYSLSGEPDTGTYRISVKVEPHGAAGNHLRAHLRTGDTLESAAPRGTFCLSDGDNPVVLLSAGIGVTPVLAMLHALAHEGSTRQVWWLHGARDGTEHPFAQESRELIRHLPNARSIVFYSKPAPGDRQGVDYAEAGHLSSERILELGLPTDSDAYLCGPNAFMGSLTAALIEAGLKASQVHTEIFGSGPSLTPGVKGQAAAPHRPTGPAGTGPEVSFARSGLTVPWNDTQQSLLELAEACDVPVQWSCRTGVCHTCELALMDGTVAYAPDPVEPPADGNILICCSKPTADVVLDL
jgi:ferredoxin-NADP reductase/MOSC domain-containing protein YiiM